MALRRIFGQRVCGATSSGLVSSLALSASPASSCCEASSLSPCHLSTSSSLLPSSSSSLLFAGRGGSSSGAADSLILQRRFAAQTLKDIEKHGAKGTSKLLKDTFPEIAMEIDRSSENTVLPSNVVNTPPTLGAVDLETVLFDSGRRVQWRCKKCAFQWVSSIMSRTILKQGCPACHKRNNPLLSEVDPKILSEIHPTKNTIYLNVETLEATDKTRIWWLCSSCNSSFQGKVIERVSGKCPCPDCDRGQFSDFKLQKTLVEEFHPTKNGDLTLAKLRPTDRLPVWWLCHSCGHEFECPISVRVSSAAKKGRSKEAGGCPKCVARGESMRQSTSAPRIVVGGEGEGEGGGAAAAKPKRGRGRPSANKNTINLKEEEW